jgi:hypothetical protein
LWSLTMALATVNSGDWRSLAGSNMATLRGASSVGIGDRGQGGRHKPATQRYRSRLPGSRSLHR